MKRTNLELAALSLILIVAATIATGFLLYDKSQPHYKNNTNYQFSLPENSDEPSISSSFETEIVYLSPSGGKYHRTPECSSLSRSKVVRQVSKQKALLLGKEPCSICYS